ncbi:MAG: LPP20 family lipoprotein [Prevotella sp.]|nr:LPP20 family lipoprotein [Prevotella sp.]
MNYRHYAFYQRLAVLALLVMTSSSLFAQNKITQKQWEAIQQDEHYLIGSGRSANLEEARQLAMADLAGRISSKVESQFSHVLQSSAKGKNVSSESKMNSIIQTYSSVTLNNVGEYQAKEKGQVVVYRYMKDSELRSMFRRRINLAKKWAREATYQLKDEKIGDALQGYYWSLALLRSCPDPELETVEEESLEINMVQGIYNRVKDILTDMTVKATSVDTEDGQQRVTLEFLHKGKPVVNFNYKTCDKKGNDCGEIYTAKDGVGELIIPANEKLGKQTVVWAEYEFRDEANIHSEIREVLEKTDPVPFAAAKMAIDFSGCKSTSGYEVQVLPANNIHAPMSDTNDMKAVVDDSDRPQQAKSGSVGNSCAETMKAVSEGMKARNYASLKPHFTSEGWDMFNKLVNYGDAKMLKSPTLQLTVCGDYTVCRSIPMSFTFKGNHRTFTEDVVFYLNQEGKICEVAFGLEAAAVNDIMYRDAWDEYARYTMVHFLETYKTAYALKRLDYISSIFSNDALIITGSIVKSTGNRELGPTKTAHVKYTRQTKEEYINSLKRCFAGNEYVNIHFGDNIVRRSTTKPNVYGIQIKQDYFSSRYGDTGYLFLLIDFEKPKEPLIHVRTWQPDKDPNIKDGRIGINDFLL